MTFHDLATTYLKYSESKQCHGRYQRLYDVHFKDWEDFPTFQTIEDWHQSMHKSPHNGNKGLSMLKAMFAWGQRRGHWTTLSPAQGIKRHRVFSRERVMTPVEIGNLIRACGSLPPKLAAMLLVLLTTGCRLSEARAMERKHVDLSTGEWYQPVTKNGKPHTTYLPHQARLALVRCIGTEDYFFGGLYEHCWSRAGVEKMWRQVRGALGVKDVRLHDFRRTLATYLYKETNDVYLVQRCINHVNQSVTAIYIRITYDDVAKALQAQADRFFALAQEQKVEVPRQMKSWGQAAMTA